MLSHGKVGLVRRSVGKKTEGLTGMREKGEKKREPEVDGADVLPEDPLADLDSRVRGQNSEPIKAEKLNTESRR